MVADFVVGIVRDVLRHVAIENLQSRNVIGSQPGDDFLTVELQVDRGQSLIRGATKFRILDPQIGLDLLQSAQERQNCDVALGDWCVVVLFSAEGRRGTRQQRGAHRCSSGCHHSVRQKRTPVCCMLYTAFRLLHHFSPLPKESSSNRFHHTFR